MMMLNVYIWDFSLCQHTAMCWHFLSSFLIPRPDHGVRKAGFLGEEVMKYHKTLTAYVNGLLQNGFELLELVEPQPEPGLLEAYPEIMRDELRRPMMLLVSARKR